MADVQAMPAHGPGAARVQAYAGALAMVAVSTLIGMWIAPRWGTAAVDMIYLPAVLAAAALWGIGPGLIAGVAAALAYNFFFTEPIHTFRMNRVADVVTVVVLLIVALVTSRLAAGIRQQARIAAAHAARNATIAGFAGRLLSCSTEEQIAEAACEELHRLFDCNAVLVCGLPEPRVVAAVPQGNRLTPSDVAAAALTLESGESAGRATARIQPAEWQFHAVRTSGAVIAAAGVARDDGRPPVDEDRLPLLMNLLDQVSLALERARADADRGEVAGLRERDRLRSALLSSVGHDLRTPLTGIIAAAAELRREGRNDRALVSTIESEAGKLERYISNLLDMARIETGAVKLKAEPVDLIDAVSAALKDVRASLSNREVSVDVPDDLPLVRADPQLLHHCLINLIDNAARHSAGEGRIRIAGISALGEVRVTVEDEGPGLPQDQERALDIFTRIEGSDREGGAGLGLAIVKAFAEAMGAKVTASNRATEPGAAFSLLFSKSLIVKADEPIDAG
jgi:two-component system, OmpR family, sensor histidine kinase KdpD